MDFLESLLSNYTARAIYVACSLPAGPHKGVSKLVGATAAAATQWFHIFVGVAHCPALLAQSTSQSFLDYSICA